MIAELLIFFSLLIAAICLHEAGHLILLKRIDKDNYHTVDFNGKDLEIDIPLILTNKQKSRVLWGGVLMGLIPLVVCLSVLGAVYFFAMFLLYSVGSYHDLKQIDKLS